MFFYSFILSNKDVLSIKCNIVFLTQEKEFNVIISKGGIKSKLSNGKGYRTDFADGTVITHRIKTSISGNPTTTTLNPLINIQLFTLLTVSF